MQELHRAGIAADGIYRALLIFGERVRRAALFKRFVRIAQYLLFGDFNQSFLFQRGDAARKFLVQRGAFRFAAFV